jgi:hypothetical protein
MLDGGAANIWLLMSEGHRFPSIPNSLATPVPIPDQRNMRRHFTID